MPARKNVYQPRPCKVCGREAQYAVNVMSRTVGIGQTRTKRKMKLGSTQLLCDECSSDVEKITGPITIAALASLREVFRPVVSA
jgi:hypothetical protein